MRLSHKLRDVTGPVVAVKQPRNQLSSAAPSSHDHNILPANFSVRIPSCRVDDLSLELILAGDVGGPWSGLNKAPDSADKEPAGPRRLVQED